MSDVLERLKDVDGGDCYNTTYCTHSSLMEDAAAEIERLRTELSELRTKAGASCVPAMHICCNCMGRGEVGESPDGANWFSVACELCKGEGKTLRYVRRPTQDKRIGNGDDFAGDAWFDQAERKIVYGAVGVDRNAAPEAPNLNDKYTFVFPDASMTKIRYIFVDGEMVYENLESEQ